MCLTVSLDLHCCTGHAKDLFTTWMSREHLNGTTRYFFAETRKSIATTAMAMMATKLNVATVYT